jgi:heme oxygenase
VAEEQNFLDIQILRRETAADHEAVEGSMPLMHEGLDTTEYVACLRQMYGVVAAWEEKAEAIAPEWLRETLVARQRRFLLKSDLEQFGIRDEDPRRAPMPALEDLPSLLGAMYVMEGSTLGGQFIAKHVETALQLEEGKGNSYFRGHGSRTGQMWKEFCEMLKSKVADENTEAVVASAKAMFAVFGSWMREKSVIDVS